MESDDLIQRQMYSGTIHKIIKFDEINFEARKIKVYQFETFEILSEENNDGYCLGSDVQTFPKLPQLTGRVSQTIRNIALF